MEVNDKYHKFEQEYRDLKAGLDRFREAIMVQIEQLLEIEQIPLGFPIQKRTKNWQSIREKIDNGRFKVKKSIKEIQDLVGLRIILLFNRDVENVCNLLRQHLEIIREYDTTDRLEHDQFGYASKHFVISIPNAWRKVPTFNGLNEIIAEIQVRTLSQHTWAEASKELQYKHEENVPRELLRSIGRASALLETVDLEFERLLNDRNNYKASLSKKLSSPDNPKLNVDILEAILDEFLPPENKDTVEEYSALLTDLRHFEISNKEPLISLINKRLEETLKSDKLIVQNLTAIRNEDGIPHYVDDPQRTSRGVFYTHCGLIRTMIQDEFPFEWDQYNRYPSEKED